MGKSPCRCYYITLLLCCSISLLSSDRVKCEVYKQVAPLEGRAWLWELHDRWLLTQIVSVDILSFSAARQNRFSTFSESSMVPILPNRLLVNRKITVLWFLSLHLVKLHLRTLKCLTRNVIRTLCGYLVAHLNVLGLKEISGAFSTNRGLQP